MGRVQNHLGVDWGDDNSITSSNSAGRYRLCGVHLSAVEPVGTAATSVPGLDGR
ncbi:MAG: hypothetical protein Q6K90_05135 [Gloeomargarita sp. HHBFW_bins_162]